MVVRPPSGGHVPLVKAHDLPTAALHDESEDSSHDEVEPLGIGELRERTKVIGLLEPSCTM